MVYLLCMRLGGNIDRVDVSIHSIGIGMHMRTIVLYNMDAGYGDNFVFHFGLDHEVVRSSPTYCATLRLEENFASERFAQNKSKDV